MPPKIAVGVPAEDRSDLEDLSVALGLPSFDPVEVRPFDGQTAVQLVVALGGGGGALRVVEVWLRERASVKKNFRVTVDGMEIVGADVEAVERVIAALGQAD
ncbi:MAG TPA: hypothetical protein VHA79_08490 [Mycobacteriales bacterium]|nr:hypothetical protein [Mycobacteriales bacterium]